MIHGVTAIVLLIHFEVVRQIEEEYVIDFTYCIHLYKLQRTSIPLASDLNSGQINAVPAYAPSTCNQIFSASPTNQNIGKFNSFKLKKQDKDEWYLIKLMCIKRRPLK